MKRVLVATCLAGACAVALSAQTPPTDKPQTTGKTEGKAVTVTGCLKSDEPNTFTLSNVKWEDKMASGQTDKAAPEKKTPPAAGAPSSTSETLKLAGAPSSVKLSEHVGHTVTITGTIADKAGTTGTTGTATTPPAGAAAAQTLNVRSMKHVSGTCM